MPEKFTAPREVHARLNGFCKKNDLKEFFELLERSLSCPERMTGAEQERLEELKPQADDERKHSGYAIPCPKHPVRNPDQHVMGQNARPCPDSLDTGKAASSGTASNTGLQPWSKNHPSKW